MMRLIKEKPVRTQDELKALLNQHGFEVTQSSLSRDITEIGLVKQNGQYALPPRQSGSSLPTLTSMESAGSNLIIIKTLVGMAAPVGITLDNSKVHGVIGTVAGDDTVFVATANGVSHETIKRAIQKIFRG